MWPLAVLTGDSINGYFYKEMYGPFAGPKKTGRYNEVTVRRGSVYSGTWDWENVFAITWNRVLFHMFYYYWGKENRSLYRGVVIQRFVISRFHCIRNFTLTTS